MFLRNVGEFIMSAYARHTPERVHSFGVIIFVYVTA